MQTLTLWAGRAALIAVLAVVVSGALDPMHDASRFAPAPDVVEHVAYGYLMTLLTIVSFPRISPWLIGGVFLGLGAGFEVAQIFGLVSGTFQWKDLVSNTAGVAAALGPLAVGRLRTS
jgi:hypothetical protein